MATLWKYDSPSLHLSHALDEHPEDRAFRLHVHENYELLCIVSGKVGYMVEGQIYDIRAGSIMLMRSAETHKLLVNGNERYERYTLNFKPELIAQYGFSDEILRAFTQRGLGERNMYLSSELEGIDTVGIFRHMENACNSLPPDTVIASGLVTLMCSIDSAFRRQPTGAYQSDAELGKRLIDHINENLLSDLSLASISEQIHMSTSQINRIFRKLTGTSVYNYILSKRLIVAQGMIAKGESAIGASQRCGFHDYSSFYRLYKKRFGTAPTAVKKNIERV